MTSDDLNKPSPSLEKVAKDKQVNADFVAARDNAPESEQQLGSEQVETDAPELNHPAPPWGEAVDKDKAYKEAARDGARADKQFEKTSREEFKRRMEAEALKPKEPEQDKGRGR